ncbi:hypothetical protein DPMN_068153 [Dreissena polymorpha]|uniref:Uncharacterized protein n=1 Tax=Dreissena polymorpha TaxID=45954 RepID=A0A9D4BTD1_DREPO|nr:hypothetical protein DPMN_068153 [Dreissena polymorpha]
MNMDFLDQSDAEIRIMKEDDTAAKGKHEKEAQQKYLVRIHKPAYHPSGYGTRTM